MSADRMRPINGKSAAKRILWGPPQNHISWAYMKELRENHPCTVYEEDPYIEVYQFRDNLYGLFHQNCDGMGDVWMWLTVGPEKCLLVDNGYGLGDLKALVDRITGGKEIIPVVTHDHFDHAFGSCRFGRVFCHEKLVPQIQAQNEHMWDYLFDDNGNNIWLQFDRKDLPEFKPFDIIGVPDGYTWDLGGGYEIELINSNGHGGPGAAMYLDKHSKILFSGDNICSDVSGCGTVSYPLEQCSLWAYRECVKRLIARIDEIDWLFPEHFIVNLESCLLYDILEALDTVLADPKNNYDYMENRQSGNGGPPRVTYYKYIKGFSTMSYGITDGPEPPVMISATRHLKK